MKMMATKKRWVCAIRIVRAPVSTGRVLLSSLLRILNFEHWIRLLPLIWFVSGGRARTDWGGVHTGRGRGRCPASLGVVRGNNDISFHFVLFLIDLIKYAPLFFNLSICHVMSLRRILLYVLFQNHLFLPLHLLNNFIHSYTFHFFSCWIIYSTTVTTMRRLLLPTPHTFPFFLNF